MFAFVAVLAVVLAAPGPLVAGAPGGAALCVNNATQESYHFTVRGIDSAGRAQGELGPGETLCLPFPGRGVVAAFETAESLEGCSRLVPAGGREALLAFGRFDRCAWATQDD